MSKNKEKKGSAQYVNSWKNELEKYAVKPNSIQKQDTPSADRKDNPVQDRKKETEEKNNKKANIGWLFSKAYYYDIIELKEKPELIQECIFKKKNNDITTRKFSHYSAELALLQLPDQLKNLAHFELTTIYPGLFTGSGMPHETHSKGEFVLGFFFDHTTGLPIIPGSSVKGVLRSAFDHPEYIIHLLKELAGHDYSREEISELERQVFEGEKDSSEKDEKGKPKYHPIPFKDRDIFFDAVIVSANDTGGKFLGSDFITPHKNDEFKNPLPLQFLKVLPGVTFRFQFILHSSLDKRIPTEVKMKLFKRILQDIGIGAKTNVGYGKFEKTE